MKHASHRVRVFLCSEEASRPQYVAEFRLRCCEHVRPRRFGDQGDDVHARRIVMKTARKTCDIMTLCIFAIGHSTRPIEEFLELLQAHGVKRLVDVRTVPRSRHNPQFNSEDLARALHNRRLHYQHMPSLGGLRHPRRDSINTAWRNSSFRGYADYMQTSEFEEALGLLMDLAKEEPTAIMCAEAVPWRCHRSLIADALLVRGITVLEIASVTRSTPLTLHPWAQVEGTTVTYPGEQQSLQLS
jgi:Protein of unknown function, DUF488